MINKLDFIFFVLITLFSLWIGSDDSIVMTDYPWAAVGGCGVGGGGAAGGGASGSLKWVGRGATGGVIDVDFMNNASIGDDFLNYGSSLRLAHQLFYRNVFGFALPFSYKKGQFQITDAYTVKRYEKLSLGDIFIDFSHKFGSQYQSSISLAYGMPIANHDTRVSAIINQEPPLVPREKENFLPPDLQSGTGMQSLSIGYEYTLERDWGTIIFFSGYSQQFSGWSKFIESFSNGGCQNRLWKNNDAGVKDVLELESEYETTRADWYNLPYPWEDPTVPFDSLPSLQAPVNIKRELNVRSVNGAKGDVLEGDYFGNTVSSSIALAYRTEKFVHSLQASYAYKITVDWYIRTPDVDYLNNKGKEQDNRIERYFLLPVSKENTRHVWSFGYGLELSSIYLPLFLGTSVAIDGQAQFQSCNFTFGVKSSLF